MTRTLLSALVTLSVVTTPMYVSAEPNTVATPTLSIEGGTFSKIQEVVVTCTTPDAEIHFTTDGRDPNESDAGVSNGGTVYVDYNMTLKAAAWKPDWTQSAVHSATFEFVCATPGFTPDGGTFYAPQSVRVTCASFAQVYYTTDGSEPNESDLSGWRGATIAIGQNTTLKARAIADGWTPSAVKSADFSFKVAPLNFFPPPGTCYGKQDVAISCATPGVTIRYTTDGSEPNLSSPIVNGPIYLDHAMTIKARAWHSDWGPGEVKTGDYQMGVPTYGGGSGTEADPYIIATKDDIIQLCRTGGICGKNFLMTADINLTGEIFQGPVISQMVGCTFDGGGHKVMGLVIDTGYASRDYLGFFGDVGNSRILRLTIENCSIRGAADSQYVGALVGSAGSWLGVCHDRERFNAYPSTCTTRPRMRAALIADCHTSGVVEGYSRVGGLAGGASGVIVQCSSTADVTAMDKWAGGLVGQASGCNIQNCFARGDVAGSERVGGLVGSIYTGTSPGVQAVRDCYSTGHVTGMYNAGGLIGFAPYPSTEVKDSFWDMQTSGASSLAGTGKTTAQMKDINTYLAAKWDLAGETANGRADYWQKTPGDYPALYAAPQPAGKGTMVEPYIITTAEQLCRVGHWTWASFELGNDIDLSSMTFAMAPIAPDPYPTVDPTSSINPIPYDGIPFMGVLDGRCHSITGLTINDGGAGNCYLGLFGQMLDGTVRRLALENCSITGAEGVLTPASGSFCAGIVAGETRLWSTVEECSTSGAIKGRRYIAGLVGRNIAGTISRCFSSAAVSGSSGAPIAGLVGYNGNARYSGNPCGDLWEIPIPDIVIYGQLTDCYATGPVTGYFVAGLVGTNEGKTARCYSTGPVTGTNAFGLVTSSSGNVTASFWDTQTSGQSASPAGTGRTTAQMMSQSTFNGWDFANVWTIDEGVGYPRFIRDVPRAVAGPDQTITVPHGRKAEVTLDGSASVGPECRPLTYLWAGMIDGAPFQSTQASPKVELGPGQYIFALTVNNGLMDSEPNTCTVTVIENQLPIAEAGADQTLYVDHLGKVTAMLDGRASSDPEGKPLTYRWSWNAAGVDCNSTEPNFVTQLPAGTYPFSLIVNDGIDDSNSDTCLVNVIASVPARLMLAPKVLNVRAHDKHVMASFAMPSLTLNDIDRAAPVMLWPSGLKADRQVVLTMREGRRVYPVIVAFFDADKIAASATQTKVLRLQIETRLKDGRYAVGSDYVIIYYPPKRQGR